MTHRTRITAEKGSDPYRFTYDATAVCSCGWRSPTFNSRYSIEAASVAARAAIARHTAHPKEEQ